jgi:hypothetical protein
MQVLQQLASRQGPVRLSQGRRRLQVVAKVVRKEGEPRIVRGKCYVTRDVSLKAQLLPLSLLLPNLSAPLLSEH